MRRFRSAVTASLISAAILLAILAGCNLQPSEQRKLRTTLFIGVDASGSFKHSGYYDNALTFLAHYIYGHLHELGGLEKPHALFVASVGGKSRSEPKTFHPIHDFEGKDVAQIEADLRTWFPPSDTITDFNPFFQEVARITKERNLVLAPITLMIVTDGVPDAATPSVKAGAQALYEQIDLNPLEYLSRNITIRLTYVSPKVGEQWRTHVPRTRVRLWTVDAEVMKGWKDQIQPGVDTGRQDRFWKWVQDNVDFRVRSKKI
ncbi:MAG: hypothetical protein HY581_08540 [Nitrospirae bacterium]|nr:hypothetical protein [Nitrospirota bacterium]